MNLVARMYYGPWRHKRHDAVADMLVREAAKTDGAAAAKGEEDKQVRYPAKGGVRVTTFAVETFGRLGDEAEVVLAELAAVRRRNLERGLPAGCALWKWRTRTLRAAARVDPERGTHPMLPHDTRAESGQVGGEIGQGGRGAVRP